MRKKDLRLGNNINDGVIVALGFDFATVVGVHNTSEPICVKYDELTPILIDKIGLEQCKFDWVDEVSGFANKHHCIFRADSGIWSFHPFCTNDKDCWIELRFIHELQNICYALTKEEI